MAVKQKILARRFSRRKNELVDLRNENSRLRSELAQLNRKIEHGCANFSCDICDKKKVEKTWD